MEGLSSCSQLSHYLSPVTLSDKEKELKKMMRGEVGMDQPRRSYKQEDSHPLLGFTPCGPAAALPLQDQSFIRRKPDADLRTGGPFVLHQRSGMGTIASHRDKREIPKLPLFLCPPPLPKLGFD